jgi:uncharacterized protein (DUF1697 family)
MALESVLTLAVGSNVLIPLFSYLLFVLLNQFSNLFQLLAKKPMRLSQQDRIQPEFSILVDRLNMDMKWLLRLSAEKEESVSMMSEDLWHACSLFTTKPRCEPFFLRTSRMTCPGKLAVGVL